MKPEFVPADEKHPAYFIVAAQSVQSFIHHLNRANVFVHPPKEVLTQSGVDYFSLEPRDSMTVEVGENLAATFPE